MNEMPYQKAEREAAERVAELLALPDSPSFEEISSEHFDPWRLFDQSVYGSYSRAFDDLAIEVLQNMAAGNGAEETIAHEMFREMLCVRHLCTYGTSPRYCFPTRDFKPLLPTLIERWKSYRTISWES